MTARALIKSPTAQRSSPSLTSPGASMPQLPNQSVQVDGMRDRLPSGSTTNNNGTPRRFRPLMTPARRHPSKGCRLRMMTTEVGRSWEWVVCGVFVRGYSPCRAFEVGITPDRRSQASAASDQDVGLDCSRGRNRRSRTKDTHDRGARQAAGRHPAGLDPLAAAGQYLHAAVRAGDGRCSGSSELLGARLVTYADDLVILCRRGKAEAALQKPARDHGQAEADGERGEDMDSVQSTGRRVRLPGIHVRANVFGEDRPGPHRLPAVKEESIQRAVEKVHALTGRSRTWQETTTLVGKVEPQVCCADGRTTFR